MMLPGTGAGELLGGVVGFLLTICILSYALGDNLLFRLVIYLFVGVSAGFAAAVAFTRVIWPQLLRPVMFGESSERMLALVPLILSFLLFTKAFPRYSSIGSPVMAFLVGVGAAVILGGATLGTLFPQIQASVNSFDLTLAGSTGGNVGVILFNNTIIMVGMLATLASFQFGTRVINNPTIRPIWKLVFHLGRVMIAITFGVIYAGVMMASLSAMIERFKAIVDFILSLTALAGLT